MTTAVKDRPAGEMDVIRVVIWNLDHNGISREGDDSRWRTAMKVLAGLKPHLLLRQELTRAHMYGYRAVWAEAMHLGGHIPFLATATPESANPTGVYVDPRVFEVVEYHEHVTGMWHPVCNPVLRLRGITAKLNVASFHLCSFDPQQRASEAKKLTTLGKPGMATIIGGDCNSYPHTRIETAPLPDWNYIDDRSHFEHRTIECDGRRVSDTRPDEILSGGSTTDSRPYSGSWATMRPRRCDSTTTTRWRPPPRCGRPIKAPCGGSTACMPPRKSPKPCCAWTSSSTTRSVRPPITRPLSRPSAAPGWARYSCPDRNSPLDLQRPAQGLKLPVHGRSAIRPCTGDPTTHGPGRKEGRKDRVDGVTWIPDGACAVGCTGCGSRQRGPRAPSSACRADESDRKPGGAGMDTAIGTMPLTEEEWQLEVTITDAPRVVAREECDTSDGCDSTCDSSCAS